MRGLFFRTEDDTSLSDEDLMALADALAVTVHNRVGTQVFWLTRQDIADLVAPYIVDLDPEDQDAIPMARVASDPSRPRNCGDGETLAHGSHRGARRYV